MPTGIQVKYAPPRELRDVLSKMQAPGLNRVLRKSLIACAELTSNEIRENQIIRGGRIRVRGPKGGKKLINAKPHGSKLTSRKASGGLRESLGVSHGIDKTGLPKFIEVGSGIEYAAIHEYGGSIRVTDRMRAALHYEGIHLRKETNRIHIPPRPFLKPGFEAVERRFPGIFVKYWEQEIGT